MATVYLIPSLLAESATSCLPSYLLNAVMQCDILFVENERTARRYLKLLDRGIVIDNFQWHTIKELNPDILSAFRNAIKENKTIGILSEAGCPGIADPGQELVSLAQQMRATVKPLVGPSSILLALMASGMNGQQFQFVGYLPIDSSTRAQAIKKLEAESQQKNSTQIFIETPYRNNQMFETLLKTCDPETRICIAVDLTAADEMVKTKKVKDWKGNLPDIHKKPAIFLLYAGS